jgi:prevent-host-death family protein
MLSQWEVCEMKDLQISKDILPVGEFKTHVSQVIRRLQATKRPFVITQNGKPAAVLITPAEFDRLNEHARFLEAVDEGFSDSFRGRLIDDEELARELDEALGAVEQ